MSGPGPKRLKQSTLSFVVKPARRHKGGLGKRDENLGGKRKADGAAAVAPAANAPGVGGADQPQCIPAADTDAAGSAPVASVSTKTSPRIRQSAAATMATPSSPVVSAAATTASPSTTSPAVSRGTCGKCGEAVLSTQPRFKKVASPPLYCHEDCKRSAAALAHAAQLATVAEHAAAGGQQQGTPRSAAIATAEPESAQGCAADVDLLLDMMIDAADCATETAPRTTSTGVVANADCTPAAEQADTSHHHRHQHQDQPSLGRVLKPDHAADHRMPLSPNTTATISATASILPGTAAGNAPSPLAHIPRGGGGGGGGGGAAAGTGTTTDADADAGTTATDDRWDEDHVRLPCSPESLVAVGHRGDQTILSRWTVISEELHKIARKKSAESYAVEEAILVYNPRYANGRNAWDFQGLHAYCRKRGQAVKSVLPAMAKLALRLPELVKAPIPLLRNGASGSVELSRLQVGCLLANAFFCTFPRRNSSGTRSKNKKKEKFPNINFNRLYVDGGSVPTAKLDCIFEYFRRITKVEIAGSATGSNSNSNSKAAGRGGGDDISKYFSGGGGGGGSGGGPATAADSSSTVDRTAASSSSSSTSSSTVVSFPGSIRISRSHKAEPPVWQDLPAPLCELNVAPAGTIEDNGLGMLQVDFANKFVGGGVLGSVSKHHAFVLRAACCVRCAVYFVQQHPSCERNINEAGGCQRQPFMLTCAQC